MTDPGGYRSYATDDLVTGEGVAVEVPVASVAARMASCVIDVVLVVFTLVAGLFVFGTLSAESSEAVQGIVAIVLSTTVLVGALNVLLITALSTVGSVIYNLAADLVGGVEVTLKEAE